MLVCLPGCGIKAREASRLNKLVRKASTVAGCNCTIWSQWCRVRMKERIKAVMDNLSHAHLCPLPSDHRPSYTIPVHCLCCFVFLMNTIHTVYLLYVYILDLGLVSNCLYIIHVFFLIHIYYSYFLILISSLSCCNTQISSFRDRKELCYTTLNIKLTSIN